MKKLTLIALVAIAALCGSGCATTKTNNDEALSMLSEKVRMLEERVNILDQEVMYKRNMIGDVKKW